MKKELRKKQGVYAVHVNLGKIDYVYIGSGKLGDRISGNVSKLKRNVHANKQLQNAYNQIRDCKVEVLQVCETKEEARELENDYIDYYSKIEGVVICNVYNAYCIQKQYQQKLDVKKVKEIKELLVNGKLQNKKIAEMYNVDPSVISKIKTGLRWASV
jgi:hypothetical protein